MRTEQEIVYEMCEICRMIRELDKKIEGLSQSFPISILNSRDIKYAERTKTSLFAQLRGLAFALGEEHQYRPLEYYEHFYEYNPR